MSIHELVVSNKDKVLAARKIDHGDPISLEHGGLSVPVKIGPDDSVTIDLSQATGHLGDLAVRGFGPLSEQLWTEEKVMETQQVKVLPKVGESAIILFGHEEEVGAYKVLLRTSQAVTIGMKASNIK